MIHDQRIQTLGNLASRLRDRQREIVRPMDPTFLPEENQYEPPEITDPEERRFRRGQSNGLNQACDVLRQFIRELRDMQNDHAALFDPEHPHCYCECSDACQDPCSLTTWPCHRT